MLTLKSLTDLWEFNSHILGLIWGPLLEKVFMIQINQVFLQILYIIQLLEILIIRLKQEFLYLMMSMMNM